MYGKPQAEHEWLNQLVGEWAVEGDCIMGPDQPPNHSTSTLSCRSLEDMWLICEGVGHAPETGTWKTVMTLGYDTETKQYTGSFIATMMSKLWLYNGYVDESGKKLVLNSEGPAMDGNGTKKYQDIIELDSEDHWLFTSQMQNADGSWFQLMTSHHNRKK